MILEIAAFNFKSALLAANAGTHRIEICENMHEGGVTPSYGAVKQLRQTLSIPIFPMVRPRGGDFLYSDEEMLVMEEDILRFKELGCEGVVLGLLNSDGTIDAINTRRMVAAAAPMEVTFHRAFDRANNPLAALQTIIDCGCKRILTSGQMPTALEGIDLIKQLIEAAGDRIIIIPGCGITSANIGQIAGETGAVELHSAARKTTRSAMDYINPLLQENLDEISIDTDDILQMKQILTGTNPQ